MKMKKMREKWIEKDVRSAADIVFEAAILKETDTSIFSPTVPLIEGVFSGRGFPVLRLYEEFSKDAKWLNGLSVLTNHEELNPDARRVGQLQKPINDKSNKRIKATTEFFKIDLTQRELEAIKSMQPINGSLHFSCNLEYNPGVYNGVKYDATERGPYVFVEYSMVRSGIVTPEEGAGFNMECEDCRKIRESKFTDKPWDGAASGYMDTGAYCAACLIDLNKPGETKTQANCKLPVQEPDGTYNKGAIRNALARISQLKGVPAADLSAAKTKLAKLAKQAGIGEESASNSKSSAHGAVRGKKMSEGQPPAAEPGLEEQDVSALEKRIEILEAGFKTVQEENKALKEQGIADKKAATLEKFTGKLKAGHVAEAAKFFEEYQKDPAAWVLENSGKFIEVKETKPLGGSAITGGAPVFDLAREQDKLFGRTVG